MFRLICRAVLRTLQRRTPIPGRRREHPAVPCPLTRTAAIRTAALRPRAAPTLRGEDVPLLRPYVLSAEEWAARRRAEPALGAAA